MEFPVSNLEKINRGIRRCIDWRNKIQANESHNYTESDLEDLFRDIEDILNILTDVAAHEPAVKTLESFNDSVRGILYLCWNSKYRDGWRLIRLLKTAFASSHDGLHAVIRVYIDSIADRPGKSDFLEYIIKASLGYDFDLFGCLPSSRARRGMYPTQGELFLAALSNGSYADIICLLRRGISLDGICMDKDPTLHQTCQLSMSSLLISLVFYFRNSSDSDLRDVLVACMEAVPYPIPNAVELSRRLEDDDAEETVERYTSILPEWSVATTTPRSLKQLSRCAVRKRLAESLQLPEGIEKLEIPQELKSLLRNVGYDNHSLQ